MPENKVPSSQFAAVITLRSTNDQIYLEFVPLEMIMGQQLIKAIEEKCRPTGISRVEGSIVSGIPTIIRLTIKNDSS